MSFDLAVWHSPIPKSSREAQTIYEQLCEGDSQVDTLPEHGVAGFLSDIFRTYPALEDLAEKDLDDPKKAVWSVTPQVTRGGVVFSIRWSVADVVADLIEERAYRWGLVVYDPQEKYIVIPNRA
ncbi:hypothetical protein [Deinococcus planocerae]|uniref:hypothetical protein n=1 Tax=Deinococcus planocerae TaxID=1737569 RepID=UPI0011AF4EBF|nr:hypothetical protein [Deinococcus planocerae]